MTPIVLTREQAAELYRMLAHQYINPNTYPHLNRLIDQIARVLEVPA